MAFKTVVSSFSVQHFDVNVLLFKQANELPVQVRATWRIGPLLLKRAASKLFGKSS